MTINETPKIKVYKEDSSNLRNGEGGEIPIFIGSTGNENPSSNILEFTNYNDVEKTVSDGGIGPVSENNFLIKIIQDFLAEAGKINTDDIGVPYVYVKDLGAATAESAAPWIAAKKESRRKNKIQVEAYVFKKEDTATNIISVMTSISESLKIDTEKGKPRIAYVTVEGWDDTKLKTLTVAAGIRDENIAVIEYDKFGRELARICTTPYYDEPGYYEFRSIKPGEFAERTDEEEEALQAAGIIFGHDEQTSSNVHPKINLAVSTAYANNEDERPSLCLLHANRNVNQLIRDAVDVVYPQLKRRETITFIQEVQADLDALCSDKIKKGYMLDGTKVTAVEYRDTPARLKLKIKANPVNITGLIECNVYV